MTEVSTYQNRLLEIYELHHEEQTAATSPTITIAGVEAHEDVIAESGHKLQRTRVYVNGNRANVTAVAVSGSNTVITVSDTIIVGDAVDIFLAATTGTLANNTLTGKLPLIELQKMQGYSVNTIVVRQPGHGTKKVESIPLSANGTATLILNRHGNTNQENFLLAQANCKYLMLILKDKTDEDNITFEVLNEARVEGVSRTSIARSTQDGIITDTIVFRFIPDVEGLAAGTINILSYDDATLSGTPVITRIAHKGIPYYVKTYPTASATANPTSDAAGDNVVGIDDATLSGTPTICKISTGGADYYLKAYPTISAEVVASAGDTLTPTVHNDDTLSGTPRVASVEIGGVSHYLKIYPKKL